MAELPTASEISGLASLLTPGIIILWVRARFRDVTTQPLADKILGYAIISIAYNGAIYPLFHTYDGPHLPVWIWQTLLNILVPLVFAAALVVFDRSDWFYRLSDRLGLRPVHHVQTAWDRTFPNQGPSYVLVHLSDGSTVAGAWTEGSFASSSVTERDLLISQLWKFDDEAWSMVDPPRSMLISGGNIRMVEFIKGG